MASLSNKKEQRSLQVGVTHLTLSSKSLDSPPSLALSSTSATSTANSAFSDFDNESPPQTPKNQPLEEKLTKELRIEMAKDFILGKNMGITYDDLDEHGQGRARRLMSSDYKWSPEQKQKPRNHETTFRAEWDKFCQNTSGKRWNDFSNVFFDQEAIENYLVIRCQRASICYMHAVAVYQQYISYIRTKQNGKSYRMIDLSRYIRENFDNPKLYKFLKTGGGGSSLMFFCDVTGNDPLKIERYSISICPKSEDELHFEIMMNHIFSLFSEMKEPALVSQFSVTADFKKGVKSSYDGESKGEKVGLHSMVLLGMTKDTDGKMWFLLQNFWVKQYLVEVSGEYMASCSPKITFVPGNAKFGLGHNIGELDACCYAETETGAEEAHQFSHGEESWLN